MKPIDKLRAKLSELFQLDQADLDFGIYRIMNAKRDEITRFLDKDLLPQVEAAFNEYKSSDRAEIKKELDKIIESVKAAGVDPEQAPKVKELRRRLADEAVDVSALENEVYDHLHNFFSRYYDEGDFISQRRYKEGVYAIPYEGEEVKLYWANHDQYYIKTSEYFRNYAFRLSDGRSVHFKIVEADTEKDNVKATNGKERRFFLSGEKPVYEENTELIIRFEYKPDSEKRKQDDINADAVKTIMAAKGQVAWQKPLSDKWQRADGTVSEKTILEKHLYDYTRRNTFDYFIHKDLGRFLRRELDFYIKNEVMHLDDVENESAPRVEQYLSKIKVIRRIANKIIDFLAQIEDFQKKLWLKKKFVVETNYCVTLDRVPEELYQDIVKNDAQRDEWVRLFAIDKIKGDLHTPKYSRPLSQPFLEANPHLVVDTKFFDKVFKERLLASFDNVDEQTNGILFHSDNFHALGLIEQKYSNRVKCIYIDPPFNTGQDFPYKDNFQESSWLALIRDRLQLSLFVFQSEANYFMHLDHNALHYGKQLFKDLFSEINELIFNTNATKDEESGLFSYKSFGQKFVRQHDTIIHGYNSSNNFVKLWKPNRNTSQLSLGQLDLISRGKVPTPKNLEDYEFYIEKYKAGTLSEHLIDKGDEKIFPIGDIWNDLYSFTQSEMRVSENVSFLTQKPENLIRRIIQSSTIPGDLVLDYFAGSGTTAVVCHKLKRKYIAVEMGDHFGTTYRNYDNVSNSWIDKLGMLGRMKNVLHGDISYCACGKERRSTLSKQISWPGGGMFKYIWLESYEDVLANLRLKRTKPQQRLLDQSEVFRESHMLRYMLDTETKGSPSLLDIDDFDDPFSYQLLIGTGSVGETRPVIVDIVETFNWLLGLKVKHMDCIEGFRVVYGTNPKDEKVLVIWRKIRDLTETDPKKIEKQKEKANEALEKFFRKQQYNTMDMEFDVIYVNGDNNLMNIPMAPEGEGLEPRYKVRLIEEEFKRLMFDVKDV